MERLEVINKRLLDNYGRFEDGRPNWRVAFRGDQFEKRLVHHTKEGLELLHPVVEERPKYFDRTDCYVLERLQGCPDGAETDLVVKSSYEPVWTFMDNHGNPVAPVWEAIFLLIRTVQENMYNAGKPGVKYKMPEEMGDSPEAVAARAQKLYNELFGNETSVGDALAYDTGVGYGTRNRKDWN